MTRTQYDPDIIRKYADQLYRRARWALVAYTGGAGLLGFLLAQWARSVSRATRIQGGPPPAMDLGVTLIVVPLALAVGYALGAERAFSLRLQAQTALCQVQIEQNTRAIWDAVSAGQLLGMAPAVGADAADMGSSEPETVAPGWRNWQTQRT